MPAVISRALSHWPNRRLEYRHVAPWIELVATVAVFLVVTGLGLWALKALTTTAPVIAAASNDSVFGHLPLLAFTLAFVTALLPATYGLVIMIGAVIFWVIAPFISPETARNISCYAAHGHSEPHDHLPESGFELGIH